MVRVFIDSFAKLNNEIIEKAKKNITHLFVLATLSNQKSKIKRKIIIIPHPIRNFLPVINSVAPHVRETT